MSINNKQLTVEIDLKTSNHDSLKPVPSPSGPSLSYSFTYTHRSIGYHNQPQSHESVTRLMYLRIHDSRDNTRKAVPSPSPYYSFTHTHRSIGYHNQTHPLSYSTPRLMYLRVYDIRDNSYNPGPSPSICYSLTHTHRSIGYRNQTHPYPTRSHTYTGRLVITTKPSLRMNPSRD